MSVSFARERGNRGTGRVLCVNSLVDDVHDAVGHEHICHDHPGAVDPDGAVVADGHGDVSAVDGRQRTVCEGGAVSHDTLDDVVGQDTRQLLGREVGDGGADGVEGRVGRGEDGDVLQGADGVDEVGGGQGAGEGGEVGGDEGVGRRWGQGEDAVDDVDGAAGEVDVLWCGRGVSEWCG